MYLWPPDAAPRAQPPPPQASSEETWANSARRAWGQVGQLRGPGSRAGGAPLVPWDAGSFGALAAPGMQSVVLGGRENPAAESAEPAPAGPGEPGRGGARGRSGGAGVERAACGP